jgi:alanine racemase
MKNHNRPKADRSTLAMVDLKAIEHNISQIRSLVGRQTEILAVVKADAYGHGALKVARLCERAGAAMLGVALVCEGVELRKAGIRLPILIQCCAAGDEIQTILEYELIPTIASLDFARRFSREASKRGVTADIHVDIDTGMGRIGLKAESAADEIQTLSRLPGLNIDGIYTHFATSEIQDDPNTLSQLNLFRNLLETISRRGISPPKVHAANSGAVINYPQSHLTLVRPGLMLYGVYPDKKLREKINLMPALRFETAIVFLKTITAGTALGYGRSFVADKPMRIATANIGYADGYPWRLSNKSKVLVRGKSAAVVGRVSMDQLLIDVTDVPDAEVGDAVTLIGKDGSECITAEDLAELAGTIPYEILCGISKRVPRHYIDQI